MATRNLVVVLVCTMTCVMASRALSSSAGSAGSSSAAGEPQRPSLSPYVDVFAVQLADAHVATDAELRQKAEELAEELDVELVEDAVLSLRGVYLYRHRGLVSMQRRSVLDVHSDHARRAAEKSHVAWSGAQVPLERGKRAYPITFDDPLFSQQWFLVDKTRKGDVNVTGVWSDGNYGDDVTVSLVDDGLDYDHPDFATSYCAQCSWDFNENDPYPLPTDPVADAHGTRCAGEIAAGTNTMCGVGVAMKSKVGGLRILSGVPTDVMEASALSFKPQVIDIYSNSWGPLDNGMALESPGQLTKLALKEGVTSGRNGLGSIYVWASGNGGGVDGCNYDGYTNSPYTISIGAIDRDGKSPKYQEQCAPQMAVTASSNSVEFIVTTDINNKCFSRHGGTSAAAPLAAGIFALMLHQRPDLTWRDINWLIVATAVQVQPNDSGWLINAAGYHQHNMFGFGKLDSWALVNKAKTWPNVHPEQLVVSTGTIGFSEPKPIPYQRDLKVATSLQQDTLNNLTVLEHVAITVKITHQCRGDLSFKLTGPSGSVSDFAKPRTNDKSDQGFNEWTFTTVAFWGEDPVGSWTLTIRDEFNEAKTGTLNAWMLTFYGTDMDPIQAEQVMPTVTHPPVITTAPSVTNAPTLPPTTPPTVEPAPTAPATDAPTNAPETTDAPPTQRPSLDPNPTSDTSSTSADAVLGNPAAMVGIIVALVVGLIVLGVGVHFGSKHMLAKLRSSKFKFSTLPQDEDPYVLGLDDDEDFESVAFDDVHH